MPGGRPQHSSLRQSNRRRRRCMVRPGRGVLPAVQEVQTIPSSWAAVAMMNMCPLCNTEMPERYNYCYQCGEYVGDTAALKPAVSPEVEAQQQQQEKIIHY